MPDKPRTIPIAEDEFSVHVEKKVSGRVRVTTQTNTLTETAAADLRHEDVQVKRVPVGIEVQQVSDIRVEGDTTIVPVFEEVLVVEKRLMLKEEIHITRSASIERAETPVALRKQEAIVEREKPIQEANQGEPDNGEL
jgi:stress response protein YsnF